MVDCKKKVGKPRVWSTPSDLKDDVEQYKKFCRINKDEIPDIESFCYFVSEKRERAGVSRETLRLYGHDANYANIVDDLKSFMAYKKKQLALSGKIPAAIFCFDFKNNHDYKDKTEQEITGFDKTNIQVTINRKPM